MKSYEIRVGAPDSQAVVVFNDRKYTRLNDAVNQIKSLLDTLATGKDLLDDDLCLWVVRTNDKKKSKKKEETELIQVTVGYDEDGNGEFCYEGVSFLSRANDFESMTLSGMKEAGSLGKYSVVMNNGKLSELCFFSGLDMILDSIRDLRENNLAFINQKLTLYRRNVDGQTERIAKLMYVRDGGEIKLHSKIYLSADQADAKTIQDFITSEASDKEEMKTEVENTPEGVVEEIIEVVTENPAE